MARSSAPRPTTARPKLTDIPLDDLILDPSLQPRLRLDPEVVAEYAAMYRDRGPDALAAIRAYAANDGKAILTRGFTRVAAAADAGLYSLPCELYPEHEPVELLRDSLSGNHHGQRLTNADKRRALQLYHATIPKKHWEPTRGVAALLGCSHDFVAAFRKDLTAPPVRRCWSGHPLPTDDEIAACNHTQKIAEGRKPLKTSRAVAIAGHAFIALSNRLVALLSPDEFAERHPGAPTGPYASLPPSPEHGYRGIQVIYKGTEYLLGSKADEIPLPLTDAGLEAYFGLEDADPTAAESPASSADEVFVAAEDLEAGDFVKLNDAGHLEKSTEPEVLALDTAPAAAAPASPAAPAKALSAFRAAVAETIEHDPGSWAKGPNRIGHREWCLLLLIVGLDSLRAARWNDAFLADAMSRLDDQVAKRLADAVREEHPHLPDLDTLCRLLGHDPHAIRLQCDRTAR